MLALHPLHRKLQKDLQKWVSSKNSYTQAALKTTNKIKHLTIYIFSGDGLQFEEGRGQISVNVGIQHQHEITELSDYSELVVSSVKPGCTLPDLKAP